MFQLGLPEIQSNTKRFKIKISFLNDFSQPTKSVTLRVCLQDHVLAGVGPADGRGGAPAQGPGREGGGVAVGGAGASSLGAGDDELLESDEDIIVCINR